MNELITMPVHTPGAVEDYFLIEGHVFSTRTSDGFKAIDRASKQSVFLWKLRQVFPVNSEAVRRFLARLSKIGDMDPPACDMMSFGVDASGYGFCVFPSLNGNAIGELVHEDRERERRLGGILRCVEALHREQIILGDICGNSFWAERSGTVALISVLGSFDGEAAATAQAAPEESLYFLAPEQRTGGVLTMAADVYALGVLGYLLFTGKKPVSSPHESVKNIAALAKPSTLNPSLASWIDEILFKCLDPDPTKRYQTAMEVTKAISAVRQRMTEEASAPRRSAAYTAAVQADAARAAGTPEGMISGMPIVTQGKGVVTHAREEDDADDDGDEESAPRKSMKKNMRWLTTAVACFVVVLGASVVYFIFFAAEAPVADSKFKTELQAHLPAIDNEQTRESIINITDTQRTLEEKKGYFQKIGSDDDPLNHDILVKAALDAPSKEESALAEQTILDRAVRLGLQRSSGQVRQWLRSSKSGEHPQGYAAILRSLNSGLPQDMVATTLKEAYPTNPRIVLRLAAALALDSGKMKEFQPVLAQLLTDAMGKDDFSAHSTLGLILASQELSLVYGEDVVSRLTELPNEDVLWLLKILAERNDPYVKAIANLAVERALLTPLRQQFIAPVVSRSGIPQDILGALIRGAAGVLTPEDVSIFGRWYDIESEKITIAILADKYPMTVYSEAFDVLAGKSVTKEPVATLIAWVRANQWEERATFAHAIGVFGVPNLVSTAELEGAVQAFGGYLSDPQLQKAFVSTNSPQLTKIILMKYPQVVDVSTLLSLLDSNDPALKVLVINRLSPRNELGVLKIVIDHYEKERDPEIRKLYVEKFWVIRDRVQGAQ